MSVVDVVFRKEMDGQIVALFPYVAENRSQWLVSCFSHCGQHSSADYGEVVKNSVPAIKDEYSRMYHELISIGYDLNILKRSNKAKMIKAFSH